MLPRLIACALLFAVLGHVKPAGAQAGIRPSVPVSTEAPYADADPAARANPLPLIGETTRSGAVRDRLRAVERSLERYADHPFLLAELGYLRHKMGQHDVAEADYARAKAMAANDNLQLRRVNWSHGWALFDAGLYPAALASWEEAERLHGGRPFWVPYTRMLAEWQMGNRDRAVASYALAVKSNPTWGREQGLAKRTAHWPKSQFDVAAAVFRAWSNTSPASVSQASRE